MKRMNIWMLSALLALPASAQKITTQHEVVDCGQVVFRKPVTAEFVLKNDGHKPLVINNVLKSCGCTEVDYPKMGIAAGESFVIKAVYDAKQMGTFTKQVCLYTNAGEDPFILSMRGKVVGSVVDFAGSYDEMLGVIKSDAQEVEFDDVNRGDRPVQRIHIFNPTDELLEPVVMHLPPYLHAFVSPSKVAPRHSAEISFVLDSKKLRDLGLNQTSVYLGERPGDRIAPEKEIVVSAVLLPGFENMTPTKKALAPKIEMSATDLNLGSFNGKKKLKGEILITNKGKSELDIRSMQMFTMGLQVNLKKSKIQPGETVKMKVTAVAADLKKSRVRHPRILMITNDPDHAKVVVKINVQ
ncbi:DUF1573 domain-containing protein [Segatella copri]|uniref:DUF1573 domain-containing protein n=1 Tax=Segatella copri TaxID=165179 RepID=A0AA92SY50_9BACT|nr:DUF1573 domain-containing protein [Segatella copri]RGL59436.1 DUF1573 domain-containing protein [Segatella copri]